MESRPTQSKDLFFGGGGRGATTRVPASLLFRVPVQYKGSYERSYRRLALLELLTLLSVFLHVTFSFVCRPAAFLSLFCRPALSLSTAAARTLLREKDPLPSVLASLLITSPSTVMSKYELWKSSTHSSKRLKQRCRKVHGWSESLADAVLVAYVQFLRLKQIHKDWDDTKLSPSVQVELMWHQHPLDPVDYQLTCALLCGAGKLVGHNPDDLDGDEEAKKTRRAATKAALLENFDENEIDRSRGGVWHEVFYADDEDDVAAVAEAAVVLPSQVDRSPHITVIFQRQSGLSDSIKVKKTARLSGVFQKYAELVGLPVDLFRFIYRERQVEKGTEATMEMLGMTDGDVIHVLLTPAARDEAARAEVAQAEAPGASSSFNINIETETKQQIWFKVKPTTRMARLFESYAQKVGEPLERLRFLYDNRWIEHDTGTTAEVWGLQEGSTIKCSTILNDYRSSTITPQRASESSGPLTQKG